MAAVVGRASRELVVLGLSVLYRQVRSRFAPRLVRSGFSPCPAGRPGLGSLMLCRQIGSGFTPYLAGRSGQPVGRRHTALSVAGLLRFSELWRS
jgi:hypothetical protein